MKMKHSRLILILFFAGLFLARCTTKLEPIDLTFTVHSYLQTVAAPETDTLYTDRWVGYYFENADTATHRFDSYEDALAGRLRALNTPNAAVGYTGKADVEEAVVRFSNMKSAAVIMLVVQPDSMIYAWRQLRPVEGLNEMSALLFFRTHRTAKYTENGWNVVPKESWYVAPEPDEKPEEPEEEPEIPE